MKMTDILRLIADELEATNSNTGSNTAELQQPLDIDSPQEPEQSTEPSDTRDQPVMMSPLQQKLELLKKGVGVGSEFDTGKRSPEDEVANIRKRAGISPAVLQTGTEDTGEE